MKEDEKDVPEVLNFFAKRAKLTPKVSSEEFQATAKLLEESKEGKIYPSNEELLCPSNRRKGRKKVPTKNADRELVKITEEDINEDNENSNEVNEHANVRILRGSRKQPIKSEMENKKDNDDDEVVNLSTSAKRRLKKLQLQHEKELKEVKAENEKLLNALNSSDSNNSNCLIIEETEEKEYDKLNVLTISYLSEISRLKCYENDRFSTIFPKVADAFHLKVSEFLLCLRDQNIKVDDTPKSLAISATDVLECIPYKADGNTQQDHDEDQLKIIFQSSDCKDKIELFIHKLEKMQDVMEKYSKSRSIPLNQLVFQFDGEKINGSETPEDLDLEFGNCIDVRVLTSEMGESSKKSEKTIDVVQIDVSENSGDSIIDLTISTPEEQVHGLSRNSRRKSPRKSPRVKVYTLENDSNDSDIVLCE